VKVQTKVWTELELSLTTPKILHILFLFITTTTCPYSCVTSKRVHRCRMSSLLRHSAKQVYSAKGLHSVEYLATAAVFRDTIKETSFKIQPWHIYNSISRGNWAWLIYLVFSNICFSCFLIFISLQYYKYLSKIIPIFFCTISFDSFFTCLWLAMQILLSIIW
jgi:hypothetical protein